ncbi:MAG: hypothetical protein ACE5H4_06395 [Candidatus Thorarchaeota archaeon]
MSSNEKDDNYWIGVRDALRMVDSFLRWASRHPEDAKSLDEFLAEGLVAAAKRCESCLGKELGLKYGKGAEEMAEEARMAESSLEAGPDSEESEPDEPASYDFEVTPPEESVADSSVTESIMDESEVTPLDTTTVETEPSSPEEIMRSVLAEEMTLQSEDMEPETMHEYEEAIESTEDYALSDEEESPEVSPTSERREVWTPYDEPPIPDDEFEDEDEFDIESDYASIEESIEIEETDEPPVKSKPPPPPPPPETDETEEERKQRARRLFFGT